MKINYSQYWSAILGVSEDELNLKRNIISSKGRYIEKKGKEFVFIFQDFVTLKNILLATERNLHNLNLTEKDILTLIDKTNVSNSKITLEFEDIDYGLIFHENFKPEFFTTSKIEIKKLTLKNFSDIEYFKFCNCEDDLDTLDLNLEEDTSFGLFHDQKIIGICRYAIIRETKIADLTVLVSPDFQKKRLAAPLVSTAIQDLLNNGLTPKYRVNVNNTASVRIAERLGLLPLFKVFTWKIACPANWHKK